MFIFRRRAATAAGMVTPSLSPSLATSSASSVSVSSAASSSRCLLSDVHTSAARVWGSSSVPRGDGRVPTGSRQRRRQRIRHGRVRACELRLRRLTPRDGRRGLVVVARGAPSFRAFGDLFRLPFDDEARAARPDPPRARFDHAGTFLPIGGESCGFARVVRDEEARGSPVDRLGERRVRALRDVLRDALEESWDPTPRSHFSRTRPRSARMSAGAR